MKRPVSIITLAAASAIAAPATASPAFDAFRQTCAETHADLEAVKGAIGSGHWTSTQVAPSTMEGVTVTESVARALTVDGAQLTLYAWRGTNGKFKVSACTVRVTGGKFDDYSHESQAWVGFAPQSASGSPQKAAWQFTQATGGRKALQKSDYDAAAAGAGIELFTVSSDGSETILDLLKIRS